jgi:hypothetical protein
MNRYRRLIARSLAAVPLALARARAHAETTTLKIPQPFPGGGIGNLVRDFGAVGDAKRVTDAAISSGSSTLTSATAKFVAGDAGKSIGVHGAGPGGANFITTITGRTDSTTVRLGASAQSSVSSAHAVYGTDCTSAFQNAFNSAQSSGLSLSLHVPQGQYFIAGPLQDTSNTNSQIVFPARDYARYPQIAIDVWVIRQRIIPAGRSRRLRRNWMVQSFTLWRRASTQRADGRAQRSSAAEPRSGEAPGQA